MDILNPRPAGEYMLCRVREKNVITDA